MSYAVLFKDGREPIVVSDDQAMKIAEAKDAGKQVKIQGSFVDTVMISDISIRGGQKPKTRDTYPNLPEVKVDRVVYNLALIELMKASRGRKVDIPDWVKPEHRGYIAKKPIGELV